MFNNCFLKVLPYTIVLFYLANATILLIYVQQLLFFLLSTFKGYFSNFPDYFPFLPAHKRKERVLSYKDIFFKGTKPREFLSHFTDFIDGNIFI